ncbi:ester cyclase [Actinacidiphila soli]|uniref:ester cyclase n=1 Tax=Actinacidiphila soli TaxID=2487275 RepID=UPI000FCB26B6|nr:ester cyclase [Actinacidiphila soli]
MSTSLAPTAPADVARAVFEALAVGDLDRMSEFSHEEVVVDFVPIGELRGPAAVRAFFAQLRAAVPDFSITVEDVIGDGHGAAVKWRTTGTFAGESFQGIEATHRRVELRGIDFMEIDSGRVRRNRVAYDGADFARQIGLLPPRGSAPDRAMLAAFNAKTRLVRHWHDSRQPDHQ